LAAAVPSALQVGQFTATGIRPLTGSTSNLYFWPHWQTILSSMPNEFFAPANSRVEFPRL
jgi:hypothetical protein